MTIRNKIQLIILPTLALLACSQISFAINKHPCSSGGPHGSRTQTSAGSKPCRSHVHAAQSKHEALSVAATGTVARKNLNAAQLELSLAKGSVRMAVNNMTYNNALKTVLTKLNVTAPLADQPAGFLKGVVQLIQSGDCNSCSTSNTSRAISVLQNVIAARTEYTAAQTNYATAESNYKASQSGSSVSTHRSTNVPSSHRLVAKCMASGSCLQRLVAGRIAASRAARAALATHGKVGNAIAVLKSNQASANSASSARNVAAKQMQLAISAAVKLNPELRAQYGEGPPNGAQYTSQQIASLNTYFDQTVSSPTLTGNTPAILAYENAMVQINNSQQANSVYQTAQSNLQTAQTQLRAIQNSARFSAAYKNNAQLARNYNDAIRIYHNTVNASNIAASGSTASLGNSFDNNQRQYRYYKKTKEILKRRIALKHKLDKLRKRAEAAQIEAKKSVLGKRLRALQRKRNAKKRKASIKKSEAAIKRYKAMIKKHQEAIKNEP